MDRTRSLLRRTYVFGAVALASIAIVVLRSSRDVESRTVEHLPPTFPAIDVDKDVRRVEVSRTTKKDDKPVEEKVVLVRTGIASWVVETSSNYPADAKKVEDALKDLAKVKTRSEPTRNPAKFAEFADKEEGFVNVRLFGEGEDPIVSFGVGRNNAEGSYSNVFLRVDDVGDAARKAPKTVGPGAGMVAAGPEGAAADAGTGRIVTATGLETYTWRDRAQPTPWIESRLFPGLNETDVADVTWTHPPKSTTAVLVRGEKPPKDPKAPPGGDGKEPEEPYMLSLPGALPSPAKREQSKQLFQSVAGLRLAGLEGAAGADADAKYGFDKPDLIVTAKGKPAKEGQPAPLWKVEVGKKVENKSSWYARRTTSGGGERGGADKWVFTIEDYELSRFRDDPKDLLEKKPEPPAPPPAPPTEPAMGDAAMAPGGEPAPGMATEPAPGMATEPAPGMATEPAMGDAAPSMGETPPPPPPAAMGETPPEPPMGEPGPAPK